eukprot:CAMPEP_0185795464 /NCGR_PEP_ID=MMETSP1174-20130828/160559_1 /TAXON_ID=35687 /ORGANISM="Dictyocha speculum, Strain CCMP1381" /LENGTH=77 /DNA_ID=CAMNT_0028490755 /DNA_START=1181 /DNA_END=1411 /DNA_ORIENTATION=+
MQVLAPTTQPKTYVDDDENEFDKGMAVAADDADATQAYDKEDSMKLDENYGSIGGTGSKSTSIGPDDATQVLCIDED